jgi:hypothetical protein
LEALIIISEKPSLLVEPIHVILDARRIFLMDPNLQSVQTLLSLVLVESSLGLRVSGDAGNF